MNSIKGVFDDILQVSRVNLVPGDIIVLKKSFYIKTSDGLQEIGNQLPRNEAVYSIDEINAIFNNSILERSEKK